MRQFNGSAAVLVAILLVLALAPLLYVASIGPVAWLADRQLISTDEGSAVLVIYAPVQYAADHNATAEAAISWYASLFTSRQQQPQFEIEPPVPYASVAPPGAVTHTYAPGAVPGAGPYYPVAPPGAASPTPMTLPPSR